MAVVHLRSLAELQRVLVELGQEGEAAGHEAMRSTARYGAAAVLRTSSRTKPRPKASGAYENSWIVTKLNDGAALSNSARHAIFVERGRLAGRAPPRDPIMEWVFQKRLANRRKASRLSKKSGQPTKNALSERARATAIAIAIQKKIARRGTRGRWVLRRTMPNIARRAVTEMRLTIRRMLANPPR